MVLSLLSAPFGKADTAVPFTTILFNRNPGLAIIVNTAGCPLMISLPLAMSVEPILAVTVPCPAVSML